MAVELMKLRLDKYLADMGIGTRTEVKKAITKGQVRVNEETVKRPEIKIDTEKDHVFYQGQMVAYAEYEYYMLNKPAGVVSATEDKNDSTVLDLIDEKQRIPFVDGLPPTLGSCSQAERRERAKALNIPSII